MKRKTYVRHLLIGCLMFFIIPLIISVYALYYAMHHNSITTTINKDYSLTFPLVINNQYKISLSPNIVVDHFEVTAYVPKLGGINCFGDCNTTAIGMKVSAVENTSITYCAVDPNVIPFGSVIIIQGIDKPCVAVDTGGAIKGKHIDVLVHNTYEAYKIGRKKRLVVILKRGEE